jgi:hypothetical protein
MSAAFTISSPAFRKDGGDGNHDIGDLFCLFGNSFVFNSFDVTIYSNDQQDPVPYVLSTNSYFLADVLKPWRVRRRKFVTPS